MEQGVQLVGAAVEAIMDEEVKNLLFICKNVEYQSNKLLKVRGGGLYVLGRIWNILYKIYLYFYIYIYIFVTVLLDKI